MPDSFPLLDVDHLRFYVGNAKQAAHFYASTFGLRIDQVADLTTGSREEASYLLTQGNIRFLLTSGLGEGHPASQEAARYGDGVKDIAFTVRDAREAFEVARQRGAEAAYDPATLEDGKGAVTTAGIKTYGRVIHSFVSREGGFALDRLKKGGPFLPRFRKAPPLAINRYNEEHPCGLLQIDHVVGNVPEMKPVVDWYKRVLGFEVFIHYDDKDISTEYSALMSKVMDTPITDQGYAFRMPINEPAATRRKGKSQIQEFLDWHDQTAGVQHVALRTDDELSSVAELQRRGVDFLAIPPAYYADVWGRVESRMGRAVEEDHQRIRDLGILVDADEQGYLLQLFTKPLQDRPTLFFEVICRRGNNSFGKGNFKALFEALEGEQARRENL